MLSYYDSLTYRAFIKTFVTVNINYFPDMCNGVKVSSPQTPHHQTPPELHSTSK